jgi:pathogenesis-related protein 1
MYKKVSILCIITILATAAILTVPSSVPQISYAQTNQDLERSILDVHNRERGAVGVAPLTWSNSLAAGAQTWAQQIATTGRFAHDPVYTGISCFQARTNPCYGENIAGFFTSVSEPDGGQTKWVNEKSSYPPYDLFANGHYTQMVWHNTKEIGCATAKGVQAYSILVCRYDPPGNSGGPPFGQGAAQAVGEEDTGFPPADQAVGEEDTGFPPADQAVGEQVGGGDGGGDGGADGN